MTRVKMLKRAAGPAGNRAIGQILEVSDDEALALLEDKAAVLLEPESAMLAPTPERAVLPMARPRRRAG